MPELGRTIAARAWRKNYEIRDAENFRRRKKPANGGLSRDIAGKSLETTLAGWLGRQDSNLGMAESKSAALPLGYAPIVAGA